MAVTSGMPKLVVFAAPQKQTATVSSLDILRAVMIRLKDLGNFRPQAESDMRAFAWRVRASGGRAAKKQMMVKRRYRARFMNTLKMTESVESSKRAPVS